MCFSSRVTPPRDCYGGRFTLAGGEPGVPARLTGETSVAPSYLTVVALLAGG
jgi:hypothetical protein